MKLPEDIFKLKDSKYIAYLPDFKKDKTQKISSIVFSLLALSFLGIFAINPTLSTIAKLRKDLDDSRFVSQKLQEKISNLHSLQQGYSAIQNDIYVVMNAVPKDPQLPTIMGQIQALSQRNNIDISSIQSFEVEAVGISNKPKDFSSFSFSVSGNGSRESIANFASSLVGMQRVISVENLSISKNANPSSQTVSFDLKGKAYFKEE